MVDTVQPPRDWPTLVPWLNIVRRLISVSRSGGHAIITMRVVVDSDGQPVFWAEPDMVRIEPRGKGDVVSKFFS